MKSPPTTTNGTTDLQTRLQDPEVRASLSRLLDRLDTVERAVDGLERLDADLPDAVSVAADVVDDALTRAADRGVVLDERAGEALKLAEKLTEPRTVAVLTALLDRIDRLERLLDLSDQMPGLVATLVDVVDAEYARATDAGYDPEQTVRRTVDALKRLGDLFRTDEFQALLDSGVLDPKALRVVGSLGTALVESQAEASRGETPSRGLFGLLGALRDPDVQRAAGFLTSFARRFGRQLR